ncbi:DUF6225 family protein, partial [Streptomyces albidochromogenes]|uniref:DUF6225 family protein n=1 Tax=Streptomyces albidochromogenes TaxID=329524 RepID=UPI0034E09753
MADMFDHVPELWTAAKLRDALSGLPDATPRRGAPRFSSRCSPMPRPACNTSTWTDEDDLRRRMNGGSASVPAVVVG